MTDASQNPAENQPQADDSDLQASANAADATPQPLQTPLQKLRGRVPLQRITLTLPAKPPTQKTRTSL